MIFYHFTSFHNLDVGPDKILAAGLKTMPCRHDWPEEFVGSIKRCVWLTTNPNLSPLFASCSEVRISLVIQSTDRRLVHLPKLMKKQLGKDRVASAPAEMLRDMETMYMYLDKILPDRFRAVEFAAERRWTKHLGKLTA